MNELNKTGKEEKERKEGKKEQKSVSLFKKMADLFFFEISVKKIVIEKYQ